ncbi:acetyl-CoA C-acetyltransferase [Kyrpidia tusciae]|uniref:acetyl-CoA C-acetyltransferase n=1 Tax=Kyrpidia tusciae (strain DSM 2912 / NBRC 15312 / T2) TaxID=562970 RepID=D5WXA4_KYRT2|nr:acetyl-CoA C-acetyltransferase [Kyrpidia tusciae]ADG07885.1 acetyl-CoA acetyltransferase [Kyrpidia tusciae DSM 2912]
MARRTAVVGAARTPFGKLGGALAAKKAVELGAAAIRGAMDRAGVGPDEVDELIMGMVLQGGAGQIPSRQAARLAGLPWELPTETINKVCASGLRAVTLGDQIIRAGDARAVVAGGMESMSQAPYAVFGAREGLRMGHGRMVDLMIYDGLWCAFHDVHMAALGSRVAGEYGISREDQDLWALRSHRRAVAAMDAGRLGEEIVPVEVQEKRGVRRVEQDEAPRRNTSLEQLAVLPPVFTKDGTVTAGNAPGVNDGAGALVLMDEETARSEGKEVLAVIHGHAEVGAEAAYIATTPALAIQKLLKKAGRRLEDIRLFEINEAFAAVVLTSAKLLEMSPDVLEEKVNVNGGAVALGHPIGASGARILMTLIYELRRRGGGLGVAAICSGAAQGDAILIEV